MLTGCFNAADRWTARLRAITSEAPPTVNGVTMRMGLLGQAACATEKAGKAAAPVASSN